ncbi:helix-turn-helix domain-containing protein, partial [Desertihabitans aurantiacus]|uniref:helix-turn-helix domain-containing protein n=1 Tax=Desertihabitans aurantiacus TaxID=2282477 RepID=UPI000DF767C8
MTTADRGSADREGADRSPESVRAVSRAVAVLRRFDDPGRRLGLAELASATGLAKSTLTRLLGTLEQEGLLARDPDGGYGPGLELLRWAGLAAELPPLPAAVTERMGALTRSLGESTTFYLRRGEHRVALARAESDR